MLIFISIKKLGPSRKEAKKSFFILVDHDQTFASNFKIKFIWVARKAQA